MSLWHRGAYHNAVHAAPHDAQRVCPQRAQPRHPAAQAKVGRIRNQGRVGRRRARRPQRRDAGAGLHLGATKLAGTHNPSRIFGRASLKYPDV
eukprot:9055105-Pyramimonas_sp.AAC.1